MKQKILPRPEVLARLKIIDYAAVRDRYLKAKFSDKQPGSPPAEVADAVAALYYIHGWTGAEIGEYWGKSKQGFAGNVVRQVFLTDTVRALTDANRPTEERLNSADIDIIFRMSPDRQLTAALNLLKARKQTKAG